MIYSPLMIPRKVKKMKNINLQKYYLVFYLTVFFHAGFVYSAPIAENTQDTKPVAWWTFNSCDSGISVDEVSNVKDSIQGNFKLVNGADGRALKLDGFTTCVTRRSDMDEQGPQNRNKGHESAGDGAVSFFQVFGKGLEPVT